MDLNWNILSGYNDSAFFARNNHLVKGVFFCLSNKSNDATTPLWALGDGRVVASKHQLVIKVRVLPVEISLNCCLLFGPYSLNRKWFEQFKKKPFPAYFLFSFVIFYTIKTVDVRGIRTQFVGVEGTHTDLMTTTRVLILSILGLQNIFY